MATLKQRILDLVDVLLPKINLLYTMVTGKEPAFLKNTAFNKKFGATAGTVTEGNDARLVEAFAKRIIGSSVTGDSNKTHTITLADGSIITATWLDKDTEFPDDVLNTLNFNINNDGVFYAITSQGEVISVSMDGRYSLIGHVHIISDIFGLQAALDSKEPTINKKTGFNKDFGATAGTVAEGNDQRIIEGRYAYNQGLINRGENFINNVDANDLPFISQLAQIAFDNGSGNINFGVNTGYGLFQRVVANSFITDTQYVNGGEIWFRTFYSSGGSGTGSPFRKVWDNVNFNPDLKANASSVYTKAEALDVFVNLNGVQTINNTKTFTTSPIVPTPALGIHAVNKQYTESRYVIAKTLDWTDIPHNLPDNFINVVLRYKIKNGDYTLDFSWESDGSGSGSTPDFVVATLPSIDPSLLNTIHLADFTSLQEYKSLYGLKLVSTAGIVNLVSVDSSRYYVESNSTRITLPIAG